MTSSRRTSRTAPRAERRIIPNTTEVHWRDTNLDELQESRIDDMWVEVCQVHGQYSRSSHLLPFPLHFSLFHHFPTFPYIFTHFPLFFFSLFFFLPFFSLPFPYFTLFQFVPLFQPIFQPLSTFFWSRRCDFFVTFVLDEALPTHTILRRMFLLQSVSAHFQSKDACTLRHGLRGSYFREKLKKGRF